MSETSASQWPPRRFPWRGSFESKIVLQRYFSGDRIVCLLCGKDFRRISQSHLQARHRTSTDEYRRRFGIPLTYGLVCSATSRLRSEIARRPENLARLARAWGSEEWIRHQGGARGKQRPAPTWMARELNRSSARPAKYPLSVFERVLDELVHGRSLTAICKEDWAPSRSLFDRYLQTSRTFLALFEKAVDEAPFRVQAACHRLGERFRSSVAALRADGLRDKTIAELLGVSARSIYFHCGAQSVETADQRRRGNHTNIQ